MTRVLIADDHTIVRDYLAHVLQLEKDFEIVALAGDGLEAVRLAEQTSPDLLLLDQRMPGITGIEAARRIREFLPQARIGLVTGLDEDHALFDSLEAGVDAYLLKEAPPGELVRGIRDLAAGNIHLPTSALRRLTREFCRLRQSGGRAGEPPPAALSEREKDVLREVVRGRSNKQIAQILKVGVSTVKTHLHGAFGKLGVEDRTQAAMMASRHGWFSHDQA